MLSVTKADTEYYVRKVLDMESAWNVLEQVKNSSIEKDVVLSEGNRRHFEYILQMQNIDDGVLKKASQGR